MSLPGIAGYASNTFDGTIPSLLRREGRRAVRELAKNPLRLTYVGIFMIIAIASFKSREAADEDVVERTVERMRALVSKVPGFISYKSYVAEDGEELEIARFDSEAALEAWRMHPEHLEAQRLGREEFFEDYSVQVCASIREYRFVRGIGYTDELPSGLPSEIPPVESSQEQQSA